MSTSYKLETLTIYPRVRALMERWHTRLVLADGSFPTVCCLVANDDDDGDPVKVNGRPCAATIKPIPYRQRVDERADAELTLCGRRWLSRNDRQQDALLDRMISYLQFSLDDKGCVKCDGEGRPKLALRLEDWHVSGFLEVAQRWGEDSCEVAEARAFSKQFGAQVIDGKGEPVLAFAVDGVGR